MKSLKSYFLSDKHTSPQTKEKTFHKPHMPFLNSVKISSDVSKLHHFLPLINKTGENRQMQACVQIPAHYQHCPKLDLNTQETAGQCFGSISRSTQGSQASVAPVMSRAHTPSVLTGSVSTWASTSLPSHILAFSQSFGFLFTWLAVFLHTAKNIKRDCFQ